VSRFIDGHRGRFGVEPICQVLGVSASAYYERASGQRSARAVEDERLLARIAALHAANYHAYGYRRMWKALLRAGEQVPRCQVQRLMRRHGIVGAKRRGRPWRTTRRDPHAHRRPDLVQRDFSAGAPDELWVADCPACAAGRAWSSSPSSSTPSAAASSAGSSPATCARRWSSTRSAWRSAGAARPTSRSCTTPIAAASPDSRGRRNSVCLSGT
jgi:HTH-like domain